MTFFSNGGSEIFSNGVEKFEGGLEKFEGVKIISVVLNFTGELKVFCRGGGDLFGVITFFLTEKIETFLWGMGGRLAGSSMELNIFVDGVKDFLEGLTH